MQTNNSSRHLRLACLAVLSTSLTSLCTAQLTTPTFQINADPANVVETGGSIQTLENVGSSGATLNVSQNSAASQPQLITSATPSGASAVRFDGVNDGLSALNVASSSLASSTAGTLFFVLKPNSQFLASIFQWQGTGERLQVAENSPSLVYVHGPFANPNFDFATAPIPAGWNDQWHLLTLVRNGNIGQIRADGVDLTTTVSFTGGLSGGVGDLHIGFGPGLADPFGGDIAEIRVYNSAPSGGDLATVEGELTATYLTAVPEPSEYAMIFGAVCVLGAVARRFVRRTENNALAA
jgi:hypothetical protein